MVNKKGFIRILEAVIAIILILGFIFWITPRVTEFEEEIPENVASSKEFIMNQILQKKEYGECIAAAKYGISSGEHGNCENALCEERKNEIMNLFENIPIGYDYWCEICPSSMSCTNLPPRSEKKSIYTNSIFVYKSDQSYNTIRIYIWKK